MKEMPILFSTAMVQAILEGRKHQTRRLIKWPKVPDWHNWDYDPDSVQRPKDGAWWPWFNHRNGSKDVTGPLKCPYGQPGDVYWVRETHYAWGRWIREGTTKKGLPGWTFKDFTPEDQKGVYHYETNPPKNIIEKRANQVMGWHRRPAIFMPYDAARIWLQKETTKVEKVCDISREDAIAEGMACITKDGGRTWKYGIPDMDGCPGMDDIGWPWQEWDTDPVKAFQKLWSKVNGAETWKSWVWVNSFDVLSTTGKPELVTEKLNNEKTTIPDSRRNERQ